MGYLHNNMVLTMDEMVDISGLEAWKIEQLIESRKLASLQLGGRVRVSRKSFEAWLEKEFAKSLERGR